MISAFIRSNVYGYIGEDNQKLGYLAKAVQDPGGEKRYTFVLRSNWRNRSRMVATMLSS